MCFALQAWFGQVFRQKNDKVWDYFNVTITLQSELGGQVLGYFETIRHPIDVSAFVDNLQRRAQELLPHKDQLPRTLMRLTYEDTVISGAVTNSPKVDGTCVLDYCALNFGQSLRCSQLLMANRPVVKLCWDDKTYELAQTDMQYFNQTFTLRHNTLVVYQLERHYLGSATWPRLFEKDVACLEVVLEGCCTASPWEHSGRALRFAVQRFRGGHVLDPCWAIRMPQCLVELDVCGASLTYACDPSFPRCSRIETLRLSSLHLSHIPPSIFWLLHLT